eukprot:11012857-Heterocapsa_arctica.AAC.1
MTTLSRDRGYHSYMVKYWQDTKLAVIRLTPKGGIVAKWSNSLKKDYMASKETWTPGKYQGWGEAEWAASASEWQAPEEEEPDQKKGAPAVSQPAAPWLRSIGMGMNPMMSQASPIGQNMMNQGMRMMLQPNQMQQQMIGIADGRALNPQAPQRPMMTPQPNMNQMPPTPPTVPV